MDLVSNDDILCDCSAIFKDIGVKMLGFRSTKTGPAMSALGSVQTGLIHLIRFNRCGNHILTIVKSLFKYLRM